MKMKNYSENIEKRLPNCSGSLIFHFSLLIFHSTPLKGSRRGPYSNPFGLFFCQFQESRHMSSMPYSASQPNSRLALAGSQ